MPPRIQNESAPSNLKYLLQNCLNILSSHFKIMKGNRSEKNKISNIKIRQITYYNIQK